MAVFIAKAAEKLLNKFEKKVKAREEAQVEAGIIAPPVRRQASLKPTVNDPNDSMLAALWAFPGRKNETLMMVRRSDERMYQVVDYHPSSRVVRLRSVENAGYEFEHAFTEKTEDMYKPFWR